MATDQYCYYQTPCKYSMDLQPTNQPVSCEPITMAGAPAMINNTVYVSDNTVRPSATQIPEHRPDTDSGPDKTWKCTDLTATEPMLSDLQSALHTDCLSQNSTPTALLSSTTTVSPTKHTNTAPVTVRMTVLNLRLLKLLESRVRHQVKELQAFYCLKSAELESKRLTDINCYHNNQWMCSSVHAYYDQQHHALLERIEQRLKAIDDKLVQQKYQKETQKTASVSNQGKTSTNPVAHRVMTNWYERNSEHPYPSYETAEVMAKAGGITVEQVKKWFANRRLKLGHTKHITEIAKRRKRVRTSSEDDLLDRRTTH